MLQQQLCTATAVWRSICQLPLLVLLLWQAAAIFLIGAVGLWCCCLVLLSGASASTGAGGARRHTREGALALGAIELGCASLYCVCGSTTGVR